MIELSESCHRGVRRLSGDQFCSMTPILSESCQNKILKLEVVIILINCQSRVIVCQKVVIELSYMTKISDSCYKRKKSSLRKLNILTYLRIGRYFMNLKLKPGNHSLKVKEIILLVS